MKSSTTNKILALIIAVLMWSYVMAVEKPLTTQTFEDIPVRIENEAVLTAANLAISETSELTTSIVLEGQRSDLKKISPEDISASINVMGYGTGRNLVEVNIKVPDKVSVEEVKTPKMQVVIEPLIVKSKPVEVSVMNLEEGTEEGAVEISPQEVEVSGAKSRVNGIESVQVTLDASQLTEKAKTVQLLPTAVDSDGMPVEYVKLSIDEVDVTAKLFRTKTVPLQISVKGTPGNGMELENQNIPKTVTIKGPRNDLKNVESIEAKPVDISGITDNATIKLELLLPENVEVAKNSADLSASFNLRDVVKKEFVYNSNEITIQGLSYDFTLTIDTASIHVIASGPQSVMNSLTKADLVPVIRAEGVDVGTSSLHVNINYNKNLNSVQVSPEAVSVTIEKATGTVPDTGGGAGTGTLPGTGTEDGNEEQPDT